MAKESRRFTLSVGPLRPCVDELHGRDAVVRSVVLQEDVSETKWRGAWSPSKGNGVATRYIFRHLRKPTTFGGGGGGVVPEIFRDLQYRIRFSGGGGGSSRHFPGNRSIAFPRCRDIFFTFSGHLQVTRRLWTLTQIQGHFPGLLTFKPPNNINSFQKKTFTKSLGGMAPLTPPPPPPATPLSKGACIRR